VKPELLPTPLILIAINDILDHKIKPFGQRRQFDNCLSNVGELSFIFVQELSFLGTDSIPCFVGIKLNEVCILAVNAGGGGDRFVPSHHPFFDVSEVETLFFGARGFDDFRFSGGIADPVNIVVVAPDNTDVNAEEAELLFIGVDVGRFVINLPAFVLR